MIVRGFHIFRTKSIPPFFHKCKKKKGFKILPLFKDCESIQYPLPIAGENRCDKFSPFELGIAH